MFWLDWFFPIEMLVVGLSGGVATGKSTVSSVFRAHGVPIIDADLVARQVVVPGTSTYKSLRKEFGDEYFDDEHGGVLRRDKLGKLIFNNPEKRKVLNGITHPAIRWEMLKQFLTLLITGTKYIVFDTPLLFESGYDKWIGTTIVVWCDFEKEVDRMMKRDNISRADAESRIHAQMDIEEKKKRATIVLDNNGNIDELREKVKEVITKLDKSWKPYIFRVVFGLLLGVIPYYFFKYTRS
uniref:Dephospho-CoA kinase n=1 Tax=Caenorhabditis tropicalis TaxID=1561998 RepID=A0A1I7UHB1_9PELO